MANRSRRRRRFGLALGGGAARGQAHIGVLKVLEEVGLVPDVIAGTSAGSIVGALYSAGYSWQQIENVTRSVDWGDMVQPVFPRLGLVRADRLEARLGELVGTRNIEDLRIPFRATAVDLISGEEIIFTEGPVATAVRASCSVPGIFEPLQLDGQYLVDGGLLNDVPFDICRQMGAEVILAVDLNTDRIKSKPPENIFNVLFYSFNIMMAKCRRRPNSHDIVFADPDLDGVSYRNLKNYAVVAQRGEAATRLVLPQLLRRLRRGLFS